MGRKITDGIAYGIMGVVLLGGAALYVVLLALPWAVGLALAVYALRYMGVL